MSPLPQNNRLGLAEAYIDLLLAENSRLHQTVNKVYRLFGDVMSDCSREVYEANMAGMTEDLDDLGNFLLLHQEKVKLLASVLK